MTMYLYIAVDLRFVATFYEKNIVIADIYIN